MLTAFPDRDETTSFFLRLDHLVLVPAVLRLAEEKQRRHQLIVRLGAESEGDSPESREKATGGKSQEEEEEEDDEDEDEEEEDEEEEDDEEEVDGEGESEGGRAARRKKLGSSVVAAHEEEVRSRVWYIMCASGFVPPCTCFFSKAPPDVFYLDTWGAIDFWAADVSASKANRCVERACERRAGLYTGLLGNARRARGLATSVPACSGLFSAAVHAFIAAPTRRIRVGQDHFLRWWKDWGYFSAADIVVGVVVLALFLRQKVSVVTGHAPILLLQLWSGRIPQGKNSSTSQYT